MDYLPEFASLPSRLREELSRHVDHEDHGSVASGIRDYLESGGQSTPELIVVLACATFLEAMEVMVDDVVPASEMALTLLEGPMVHRALPRRVDALKLEIEGVLRQAVLDALAETTEAEEAIASSSASVDQLVSTAHRQWEKKRYEAAASLFLQAAEQESKEAARRSKHASPDHSMSYLVRAGQCLYKANRMAEALPLLRRAVTFDWKAARLWNDRHTTEWAFVSMLEERALANDWGSFGELWNSAAQRAEQLQMKFPFMHPHQELLLDLCLEAGQLSYLPIILQRIEERESRIPRKLQQRVSEVKQRLAHDTA